MSPKSHLRPDLRGRFRHHRMGQRRHNPQRLGGWCKALSPDASGFPRPAFRPAPTARFRRCIYPRPRPAPKPPSAHARTGIASNIVANSRMRFPRCLGNDVIRSRFRAPRARRIRHLALEIAGDHGQRAAGQIAQPIRQIGVVALHQRIEGKRSILPKHDFAQQKITQRVRAEHVENRFRTHDVAARLRHLALFKQQPSMRHNRLRHRQSRRHQKRRPVDAMEADDFFANHLHVGGPEFLECLLRSGVR